MTGVLWAQSEPIRYKYHLWGEIRDEQTRPVPGIMVCFVPAVRPINGRIPCTKTDNEGNYAFTVKEVPDKYFVSAPTDKFPIPMDKNSRTVSTTALSFADKDECRQIILQFKPR